MLALVASMLAAAAGPELEIDWSGTRDETVARCGLGALYDALVQTALEEGYAVVRHTQGGVQLVIASDAAQLTVVARHAGSERRAALLVPESCDSTLLLDLRALVVTVLRELGPPPAPAEPAMQGPAPTPPRTWGAGLAAGGAITEAGFWTLAAGLEARLRLGELAPETSGWLTASIDVDVWGAERFWVVEPSLQAGATLARATGAVSLEAGLEAGVVVHTFGIDGRSGAHADGRFSLPLRARLTELRVGVLVRPLLRLVPVEHRREGVRMYASGYAGVTLALELFL